MLAAKWALIEEINKAATFAARFTCQAGNFDRPIAETPWLAEHRYGDGEFDARWYAVMNALDGFHAGLPGRIEDALNTFAAVAFMAGMSAAKE